MHIYTPVLHDQLSGKFRRDATSVSGHLDRMHVLVGRSADHICGDVIHEVLHLCTSIGFVSDKQDDKQARKTSKIMIQIKDGNAHSYINTDDCYKT